MTLEHSGYTEDFDGRDERDYFQFPLARHEVKLRAREAVDRLGRDPSSLSALATTFENNYFLAETEGDVVHQDLLTEYLNLINKGLGKFRWKGLREKRLTEESALSILKHLPNPNGENLGAETTPQQRRIQNIAKKLARGYLNKRFEHSTNPGWREAVFGLKVFLDTSIHSGDLEVLQKFYYLTRGGYESVVSQDSLVLRSLLLCRQAANPKDEELWVIGSEIDDCELLIASTIDLREELVEVPEAYRVLMLQLEMARLSYEMSIDPAVGIGRRTFKASLQNIHLDPVLDKKYGDLPLERISRRKLTPEVLEVAKAAADYPERYTLVRAAAADIYSFKGSSKELVDARLPADSEGRLAFPYNILLQHSASYEELSAVLDQGLERVDVEEAARNIAEESGEPREIVPFSQLGIQGYLIVDPKVIESSVLESPKLLSDYIRGLIIKERFAETWFRARALQRLKITRSVSFERPGITIIIVEEGYDVKKTRVETILDLRVPGSLREKEAAHKILNGLSGLRREIPRKFTQMPTLAGDEYPLNNHPDLPSVFGSALIKKRPAGGIFFEMNILPMVEVVPDEASPHMSGIISFPESRVKIDFDGAGKSLPNDLKWISEGVLLRLLERSCCVPLSEDELRQQLEAERELEALRRERAIPGRLVHVGGFRLDGSRKQFTEDADVNFRDSLMDLGMDTAGLSLAKINRGHWAEVPDCDRFLTWNRGHEPEITPEPTVRNAPDRILPVFQDSS